jgi:hypothetical protein
VLLALIVVFLAGVEVFTRRRIVRMSKIEARVQNEYEAAVATKPSRGRKTVLLLGNSLMGEGVRFDDVQAALKPDLDLRRLYVENTDYYDFFYGIRRLFAEGARFNYVVVFLTPRQLIFPGVRGDYFAYRLMAPADIFRMARDTGLDRTDTSDMFFAHFSAFYGLRSEIRKVLLARLLPDLPALMTLITGNRSGRLSNEEIYRGEIAKLTAFRELAAARNSRIILVLPPQTEPEGADVTQLAARQTGITVVTVSPGVTGASDFRDGFHLNDAGARKYTTALIPELARALR